MRTLTFVILRLLLNAKTPTQIEKEIYGLFELVLIFDFIGCGFMFKVGLTFG